MNEATTDATDKKGIGANRANREALSVISPHSLHLLGGYLHIAIQQFGWPSLLATLVPFCFLRKMGRKERALMLGIGSFFVCTSILMMIVLNPPPDRQAAGIVMYYFSPSFLLLAIWAGFGLMLLGTIIGRAKIGASVVE